MSLSPALRRAGSGVLVSALVLGAQTVLAASPAAAATSYTVSTTADVATNAGACGSSSTTAPSPLSLREATCLANNSGAASITINVPAGTYTLVNGELKLGKVSGSNITLVGAGAASTIIDGNNTSRVLDLDSTFAGGVSTAISGVTISNGKDDTNGGAGIIGGSGTHAPTDSLTLTNVVMTGNHANVASPAVINRPGGALQFLGGSLSIVGSTFSNNSSGSSDGSAVEYGAYGIASPEGLTIDSSTFSGNTVANTSGQTATAKGGALSLFGTAGSTFAVSNSRFVNNAVTATAGSGDAVGAGILQHSGQLTVTESAFTGNTVSGGNGSQQGGAVKVDGSATATLRYNRFAGNTAGTSGGAVQGDGSVTATQNWWACNAGPGNAGCDTTAGAGMLTTSPRLVLTASVSPATIAGPNASGTVSATFATDSAGTTVGATNLDAFAALPVTFSDPPGDATVTLAAGAHAAAITSGTATIDLHTNTTSGPSSVNTTFDNATVGAPYTVTAAPAITSANTVSFQNGQASTFTVTTTGYPTPAITRTGALPTGVTFTDNGNGTATLAGTPTQGGSFPLSLTAANGVTPNATQTLTLNVGQPPAITSAASATFTSGSAGSFTVTTSGVPTVSTITETGALPAGLSFTDNGNGTATLAGTPTDSGTFPVTLTATNGLSPNATQSLTVTVNKAPAITTNPSDQTVSPGSSVTFTAAASGFPSPTVQWQRSTNGGASFSNIAGATSTSYTFTAAAGDNGNLYRAVFTNLVSSATTTAAALNVGTAPTFTSAATTRFQVGTAGTFGITTTGVPSATLSRLGVGFPAWLTLTDNGDGTGTLTGTPPAGFGGSYTFTLKAANGFSPSASQNFTLNVDDSPVITSTDHATFEVGTAGSFAVTATAGYPTSTALTRTGTLPTGVTFVDNGDGTATLAGTPATGKGGSYPITITATATGGTAPAATQSFTLRVDEKPAITSADHATFAVGAAGSFTVTTTAGFPVATTLSRTGSLPTGVTFTDNGDGTATIAGTPGAATGGSYGITLIAHNDTGDTTQSFTLTTTARPIVTSADHATFAAGSAGSFAVTTTAGFPAATTLAKAGALPAGVTFTDNGDGTATIAGTPDADQGGSYPLTFTATNSAGNTTQSFTLTVTAKPTITSTDHATFPAGSAGTFTVTTTPGFPTARTLTRTGALPSGVTFTDNGDGTATIAGTPTVGGTYDLTLTAHNDTGDATQSFTLTVTAPPAFTSADHATLTVGDSGTFTVTTSGFPAVAVTKTGALPAGVTFTDNGDGTATIAGSPDAGTAGIATLTLTATNSVDHADQTFTLTVQKKTQTITVSSSVPTAPGVGGSYVPAATSSSDLAVTIALGGGTTNAACSLTSGTVSFDHVGHCEVVYTQAGDGTYAAATTKTDSFDVVAVATTTALSPDPLTTVFGEVVQVTATVTRAGTGAAPAGTVQFTVDGLDLGGPVTVTGGTATSPDVDDTLGSPLQPGAHALAAVFTPTDPTTFAGSTGLLSETVNQASTTTKVTVQPTTVKAVVAPVAPGAGSPTGTVTFRLSGAVIGTAAVSGAGTATLAYTVPAGQDQAVSAEYSGDLHFLASSDSLARTDPDITATVSSAVPVSAYGWYRTPVTVTFTCTTHGAPLTEACPAPVTLAGSGGGQSVTRTIAATDGGMRTVSVTGINVDLDKPSLTVTRTRKLHKHPFRAPKARCDATDPTSGIVSCTVKLTTKKGKTRFVAVATDLAGNTLTATGRLMKGFVAVARH